MEAKLVFIQYQIRRHLVFLAILGIKNFLIAELYVILKKSRARNKKKTKMECFWFLKQQGTRFSITNINALC